MSNKKVLGLILFFVSSAWGLYTYFDKGPSDLIDQQAYLYKVQVNSVGYLQVNPESPDRGLKFESALDDMVMVSREPLAHRLWIEWTPHLKLLVNDRHLEEQEQILKSLPKHTMGLEVSESGVPEKIYYQEIKTVSPQAAEIVANMGKMILLQLAWESSDQNQIQGLDIWGDHRREWKVIESALRVQTHSVDKTQSTQHGNGTFDLQFDKKGTLVHLSGKQVSSLNKGFQMGSSETTYQIQRVTESLKTNFSFSLSEMIEEVPWINVNSKALITEARTQRSKGWNLTRVLEEAATLHKTGKTDARDLVSLAQALEDLLALSEDLAQDYADLALKLGPNHFLFNELIKALRVVGGEKSQLALQRLLQEYRNDESASTRLMLAMAFLDKPTRASQAALEELAHTPESNFQSRTAELSLGQMAYQLNEEDPNRAKDIVAPYQQALKEPKNTKAALQALNVLGNSGICDNWDELQIYLNHANFEIYKRALEALRFCRDPRVADTLYSFFIRNQRDRELVVEILEMRLERQIKNPELAQKLQQWLEQNPSPQPLLKKRILKIIAN